MPSPSFRNKIVTQYSESEGPFELSLAAREASVLELERCRKEYIEARENHFLQHYIRYFGVSIFGSARIERGSSEWQFVHDLGKEMVSSFKVHVITGGGPGVMEAAHLGARNAILERKEQGEISKARNIGIGIVLPHEQGLHPYVDIGNTHETFTTRKQEFLDRSHGMYASHGGLGTFDEIAEIICAKQCGQLEVEFPIVLHPQWEPHINLLQETLYKKKKEQNLTPTMKKDDLDDVVISDDIPEIVKIFKKRHDDWQKNIKAKVVKVI